MLHWPAPLLVAPWGASAWLPYVFICAASVAAVSDYYRGRIYNWLTLPLLVFGLLVSFVVALAEGLNVIASAGAGFAAVAVLFIPLFAFRVVGGGDVKLLAALSLPLGFRWTLELVYATLFVAGIGSLVLLFVHRRAGVFAREVALFFVSLTTPGMSRHWPRLSSHHRAPFGIAIWIGYIYIMKRVGAL